MIEIKSLTDEHIGRMVIYGKGTPRKEMGVISSWNGNYIFVRYGGNPKALGTRQEKLFWPDEKKTSGRV